MRIPEVYFSSTEAYSHCNNAEFNSDLLAEAQDQLIHPYQEDEQKYNILLTY